jgi:hypothetical protein
LTSASQLEDVHHLEVCGDRRRRDNLSVSNHIFGTVLDNALRYCGVRARSGVLRALRQPVSRLKLRSEQRKTMRQRGH